MKILCVLVLCFILVGCAKPLPKEYLWAMKNGKLYLTHYSPHNEHWYNYEFGCTEFNAEEVEELRKTLDVNKLTAKEVKIIRRIMETKAISTEELSKLFNVHITTIRRVNNRIDWKHI